MSVDPIESSKPAAPIGSGKSPSAFRTITEVASELDLPQHVLRFWETKFPQIRPMKRRGGRRYYRPEDVVLLREVRRLLYVDGYTIRGVQKLLRQQGRRALEKAPVRPSAAAPAGGGSGQAAEAKTEGPAGKTEAEEASATAGADTASTDAPKWRRDMEMSTVLRKELLNLLEELEELRALLPANALERSD